MIVTYRPIDWLDWLSKDKYRVGDDGSVWSFWSGSQTDRKRHPPRWKRLAGGNDHGTQGARVVLKSKDKSKAQSFSIAHLVLRAFVGPRPIGCIPFRFPDRSVTNDSLVNLRWTPRGDCKIGCTPKCAGSKEWVEGGRANAKTRRTLRDKDVSKVFALRRQGWQMNEIATRFGVTWSTVRRILNSECYKDVPADREIARVRPSFQGDRNPNAKLTELDVTEIRELFRDGRKSLEIAREYGVTQEQVVEIVTGKKWGHVSGAIPKEEFRIICVAHRAAKLKTEDIPQIRAMLRDGLSQSEVGRKFGVTQGAIRFIAIGKTWAHVPDSGLPFARNGQARGSRSRCAKLSESDIPEIRRMYREGMAFAEIGRTYGVNYKTIGDIVKGKNWAHVA